MPDRQNNNVLVITYYWPPAGGPGVQRWLKFVKYLPYFKVRPHVYVPENPDYPIIDTKLNESLSNQVKIIKKPIFEPFGIARFFLGEKTSKISSGVITEKSKQSFIERCLLWVRGNLFIPDARKFWIKPSVKFLNSYIKKHQIQTIITTGPPHSLHLIGLHLKKKNNLHWIADFRDPWVEIGYHQKLQLLKRSKRKHQNLEKQVLNNCDQIITTSRGTARRFRSRTITPIEVITNGYDDFLLESDKPIDPYFSLSHIGSLLTKRNPLILWEVLGELTKENESFKKKLRLNFYGTVSQDVIKTIKHFNLTDNLHIKGYISHQKALEAQRTSQILLLIEIDSPETKEIIPGKLFEYLHANRPILAIGPEESDIIEVINQTNSGHFFTYKEKERLKQQLLTHYKSFKNNNLNIQSTSIEKFHRKELTKKLVELLPFWKSNH